MNKTVDWSFKRFSKTCQMESSHQTRNLECFADRYSIPWNLPIIFHSDLIATIPQTYLLYSAHCSLSNLMCLRSVWCRCTMVPIKIFTSLAKFQGIVSVNDFTLPIRLQELLQAPFGFLRSFCFARIRLDPLSGQVVHHDCISMIVSRFTTCTENFVFGCYQVTKIFCTKYDSANTSSARSPCDFGPLADLAISVFREVDMKTVFTQIHTSHGPWRWFMRRTCVWVSVFKISFIHKIISEFLEPFRYVGIIRVSKYLFVTVIFWVLGFWLVYSTTLLMFQENTGLSVLVYPHYRLTRLLEVIWMISLLWRCHGCWSRRAWGRFRMINFLP